MNHSKELHDIWNKALSFISITQSMTDEEKANRQEILNDIIFTMRPPSLYRYRAFNDLNVDAFKEDRLYISTADHYTDKNDSFIIVDKEKIFRDINYVFDHFEEYIGYWFSQDFDSVDNKTLKEQLTNLVKGPGAKESILRNKESLLDSLNAFLSDNSPEVLGERYRSYSQSICFCERGNDPYMMQEYADDGHGFVLEYDIDEFKGLLSTNANVLWPIAYTEYAYDATEYYKNLLLNIVSNGLIGLLNDTDILAPHKIQLFKERKHYSKEHEWRLLFLPPQNAKYITIKPKSIRLGTNLSAKEKEILILLAQNKGLTVLQFA